MVGEFQLILLVCDVVFPFTCDAPVEAVETRWRGKQMVSSEYIQATADDLPTRLP